MIDVVFFLEYWRWMLGHPGVYQPAYYVVLALMLSPVGDRVSGTKYVLCEVAGFVRS